MKVMRNRTQMSTFAAFLTGKANEKMDFIPVWMLFGSIV
jgi:hypothetical protein